jgi:hypothetical protein
MKIAARPPLLVEFDEDTLLAALLEEALAFFERTVADDDVLGLAKAGAIFDPGACR